MKQFTSHIDFSLTKKRFVMMAKKISRTRITFKRVLLIPVLEAILFTFCTVTESENPRSKRHSYDIELVKKPVNVSGPNAIQRAYDKEGNLFTGTQKVFSEETGSLFKENTYKDGLPVKTIYHYEPNQFLAHTKVEYTDGIKATTTTYFKNGNKWIEGELPTEENNYIGTSRHWYQNGQLKFEVKEKPGLKNYHGLMTLYDEKGNILEQERYEDGELIEKIK